MTNDDTRAPTWDPERYERFREQRLRPGLDLIDLVEVRPGLQVVDLGCGTGRLTRALADRLPESSVLGIDHSAEMLARATEQAGSGVRFEQRAIDALEGEYDVIYSNAALHWLPEHQALIPRLFGHLRPGGQLAVQVPDNHNHPVVLIRNAVVSSERFAAKLADAAAYPGVLQLHEYAELLHAAGGVEIDATQRIYAFEMASADAIVEFQSGTALLPYMKLLGETDQAAFIEAFRDLLRTRYAGSPVLFPFRRAFLSARRPS